MTSDVLARRVRISICAISLVVILAAWVAAVFDDPELEVILGAFALAVVSALPFGIYFFGVRTLSASAAVGIGLLLATLIPYIIAITSGSSTAGLHTLTSVLINYPLALGGAIFDSRLRTRTHPGPTS